MRSHKIPARIAAGFVAVGLSLSAVGFAYAGAEPSVGIVKYQVTPAPAKPPSFSHRLQAAMDYVRESPNVRAKELSLFRSIGVAMTGSEAVAAIDEMLNLLQDEASVNADLKAGNLVAATSTILSTFSKKLGTGAITALAGGNPVAGAAAAVAFDEFELRSTIVVEYIFGFVLDDG